MSKLKTIQDVYDAIPTIACQGKCSASCGVIPLFPVEGDRIQASGGSIPTANVHLSCSELVAGRCSIYADRPLICRLFGVVPEMKCPHGCKPDRWLTSKQVQRLMAALMRLSDGNGASVQAVSIDLPIKSPIALSAIGL